MSSPVSGNSPSAPVLDAEVLAPPPPPNSLSLIGMVALLAGLIGLVSLCAVGSMVATSYNAAAPVGPAADASAVERFQYDMQVEMSSIGQRYLPGHIGFMAWHLFLVLLLVMGGIGILRRTQSGRQFLLYVMLFALLFEVLRSGMYVLMILELLPMMDESLVRSLRRAGQQSPAAKQMLERMAQGMTVAAVVVGLVWPALKILFYGWAARYLASQRAIDACTPRPSAPQNLAGLS